MGCKGGDDEDDDEDIEKNVDYIIQIGTHCGDLIKGYFVNILGYEENEIRIIGSSSKLNYDPGMFKTKTESKEKEVKYVRYDISKDPTYKKSSEDIISIRIDLVKFLMDFFGNRSYNTTVTQDNLKASKIFQSLKASRYGVSQSSFTLDWWQDDFRDLVRDGESLILVGDTSGGKTFISIMAIKDLLEKEGSDSKIIYLAPTSQLAISQYANLLKVNKLNSSMLGICCKSMIDIPEATCRVIFGTPTFIKRYLYRNFFDKNLQITKDNVESAISRSFANRFVESCNILFIDEVQTLSPTYVQSQEIEQQMECKAIEEIIESVKMRPFGKSTSFKLCDAKRF